MVANIKIGNVIGLAAAVFLVLALGSTAFAQGSFSRDDLQPILEQQPAIAAWVANGLDLDETGDAMRIGQNVNPNLGGLRVGPYVILAKPKGAAGPFTLEITVETEMNCLDDAGKTVELEKATTIVETFSALTVRPYTE